MILSSQEIKELIEKKQLISNYVNLDIQLQQAGFDLTLAKIYKMKDHGVIDFDNKQRKISETEEIGINDGIHLGPGVYKVRFNEIFKIPEDIAMIGQQKSSLIRNGATIPTALGDPGFEGIFEGTLIVQNPYGLDLKKNARLLQFIFVKLNKKSKNLYNGKWKNLQDKT